MISISVVLRQLCTRILLSYKISCTYSYWSRNRERPCPWIIIVEVHSVTYNNRPLPKFCCYSLPTSIALYNSSVHSRWGNVLNGSGQVVSLKFRQTLLKLNLHIYFCNVHVMQVSLMRHSLAWVGKFSSPYLPA